MEPSIAMIPMYNPGTKIYCAVARIRFVERHAQVDMRWNGQQDNVDLFLITDCGAYPVSNARVPFRDEMLLGVAAIKGNACVCCGSARGMDDAFARAMVSLRLRLATPAMPVSGPLVNTVPVSERSDAARPSAPASAPASLPSDAQSAIADALVEESMPVFAGNLVMNMPAYAKNAEETLPIQAEVFTQSVPARAQSAGDSMPVFAGNLVGQTAEEAVATFSAQQPEAPFSSHAYTPSPPNEELYGEYPPLDDFDTVPYLGARAPVFPIAYPTVSGEEPGQSAWSPKSDVSVPTSIASFMLPPLKSTAATPDSTPVSSPALQKILDQAREMFPEREADALSADAPPIASPSIQANATPSNGRPPFTLPRRIENPFPRQFPGSSWIRVDRVQDQTYYLEGRMRRNNETLAITAVPGEYSPIPPRHLQGFGRYIQTKQGGFWVRVQKEP